MIVSRRSLIFVLQEEFEAVTRQGESVLGKKGDVKVGQGGDAVPLYGGEIQAMHAQAQSNSPPGSLVDASQVSRKDFSKLSLHWC